MSFSILIHAFNSFSLRGLWQRLYLYSIADVWQINNFDRLWSWSGFLHLSTEGCAVVKLNVTVVSPIKLRLLNSHQAKAEGGKINNNRDVQVWLQVQQSLTTPTSVGWSKDVQQVKARHCCSFLLSSYCLNWYGELLYLCLANCYLFTHGAHIMSLYNVFVAVFLSTCWI